jgi:hypothetical protein
LRPMREPSCKRIAKHGSATGAISDEIVPRHPSAPPLDRHRACAPKASCERNALGGSGSLQCPEQDVLSGAEVQERLALQSEAERRDRPGGGELPLGGLEGPGRVVNLASQDLSAVVHHIQAVALRQPPRQRVVRMPARRAVFTAKARRRSRAVHPHARVTHVRRQPLSLLMRAWK